MKSADQIKSESVPEPWVRLRFYANLNDYRPVHFPPPGPYWCSGFNDTHSVIVAYLPQSADVHEWWPEAENVESEDAPNGPQFTSRFPRPKWFATETDA